MEKREKILAIFDLDGTLVSTDTFIDFLVYCFGGIRVYTYFLSQIFKIVLLKFNLYNNSLFKEEVVTYFFKGKNVHEYRQKGSIFGKRIPKDYNNQILEDFKNHQSENNDIVILTASFSLWLNDWAKFENVQLIASELEVKDDKFTGKIKGKNCYGLEKLIRLKEAIRLDGYTKIYAYGNDKSDKYYMDLADVKKYV